MVTGDLKSGKNEVWFWLDYLQAFWKYDQLWLNFCKSNCYLFCQLSGGRGLWMMVSGIRSQKVWIHVDFPQIQQTADDENLCNLNKTSAIFQIRQMCGHSNVISDTSNVWHYCYNLGSLHPGIGIVKCINPRKNLKVILQSHRKRKFV